MNLYIRLMNEVIDYIEENIVKSLTLQDISEKFYLSEFHFSRMFKILTGISLKHYINGRRLTLAAESLKVQGNTVTKTAFDYGFEYPEVFSRAFKRQFSISPSVYMRGNHIIERVAKASVIERDITNAKGSFTIKENNLYLDDIELYGTSVEVNENHSDFNDILNSYGSNFLKMNLDYMGDYKLYAAVNCHEDESGAYTVFYGAHFLDQCKRKHNFEKRIIPAGWYACFQYYGDMLDIRNTFVDDLYRWIMIRDIELNSNGIGMLNIFDVNDIYDVQILIPIIRRE